MPGRRTRPTRTRTPAGAALLAVALAMGPFAFADGTPAGTTIDNSAIVSFDLGECSRERLHDRRVQPVLGQRREPVSQPHEPLGRGLRAKNGDGMRLERQRHGRHATVVGVVSYLIENHRVSAVDAIEITDGDDGTRKAPASSLQTSKDPQRCAGLEGPSASHLL